MIQSKNSAVAVRKKTYIQLNLPTRITGLFYGGYGLIAAAKLWQYAQDGHHSVANDYAGAILLSFALFGLLMTLAVDTLTVDPTAKTYSYRKGIEPFAKVRTGPIGEIRAISISRHVETQSDGETSHTAPTAMLSVLVEWRDGRPPVRLYANSDRVKTETKAAHFSELLGVPVTTPTP